MAISELIPIVKEALVNLGCELESETEISLIGIDVVGIKYDKKYIIRVYDGKGSKHVDAINKLSVIEGYQKALLVSKPSQDMLNRHQDQVIILDKNRLGELRSYRAVPTKTFSLSITDDYPNKIASEILSFCKSAIGHHGEIKCALKSPSSKGVVEIEGDGKSSYGRPNVSDSDPEWDEFNKRVPWLELQSLDAKWHEDKRCIDFYSHPYDPNSQLPQRIKYLCSWIFGLRLEHITCTCYEIPDIRRITSS